MAVLELPKHDVVGIRAANPGPFTLSGTNSWLASRDPCWLIDPGPNLADHVESLRLAIAARGALGGIALTHDHPDHAEAVPVLRTLFPESPVAAARGEVDVRLRDGDRFGALTAVSTPGHAPDHLAFVLEEIGFSGDAVLGEGSVFITPYPGALRGYLQGLERLQRLRLSTLCPGHGPIVSDVAAKLEEYIAHRLERERRLVTALQDGRRTAGELLDEVWDDAPAPLRPAAAVTLAAHLDKLRDEGRLPDGVERPDLPEFG